MTLINEYFKYQKKHEEKYGEKTIVMIQIGKFYEVYSVNDMGKAQQVSKMCNMVLTLKNKNEPLSFKNPNMCGMPVSSKDRYVEILTNNGYTVAIYTQNEDNTQERYLENVMSPGTAISETKPSVVTAVYIDGGATAVTFVNVNDGTVGFHEIYDKNTYYRDVEMKRIVQCCESNETVYCEKGEPSADFARVAKYENTYENIEYQNKLFKDAFEDVRDDSSVTPIEQLNLNFNHCARVSLCVLLRWCADYKNVSKNLRLPKPIENDALILHSTSVEQLQLINDKVGLFDVINKTRTPMGRRMLRKKMIHPSNNADVIKQSYDDIEYIKNKKDAIVDRIKNINDMERMSRSVSNGTITIEEIRNLISNLEHAKFLSSQTQGLSYSIPFETIEQCYAKYTKNIDVTSDRVFNEGVHSDIDDLLFKKKNCQEKLTGIAVKYSKMIGKSTDEPCSVKVELINGGYHVTTTTSRARNLREKVGPSLSIETLTKQKVSLKTSNISTLTNNMAEHSSSLDEVTRERFAEFKKSIRDDHAVLFRVSEFVSKLDVTQSHATVAELYDYVRPVLTECERSYVKVTNLRHAIVERLDQDTLYTGNDISFEHKKGLLLYGVNGSGKSCFSKSLGISVVMAQMGMYVPADYFELCPYDRLFTRISSEDNIYSGHSSFAVEMMEIRNIINHANERSIVIGDEICKGTENTSAISIMVSTVNIMSRVKSTFVLATHLHSIMDLDCMKNVKENLHVKHTSVDIRGNVVVYNRTLKDGQGDTLYGVNIAASIVASDEFSAIANATKDEVLKKYKIPKTSKYNSKVLKDMCNICTNENDLDSHHIIFQSKASNNVKNAKGNLVTLCKKCHDKVHSDEIVVSGWKSTSRGRVLVWSSV